MIRRGVEFALTVSILWAASLAAAQPSDAPPTKLPVLTQDQYSIYLACLEDSALANAKDSNPLATVGVLNALWTRTIKQTSLKGLSMAQLAQVTDHSIHALAAQQMTKPAKLFKQFATQTPAGCLTIAQSLQE